MKELAMSNPEAAKIATAVVDPTKSADELAKAVANVLKDMKAAKVAAASPVAPNWATMTEAEAMQASTYIPAIDHELPDYLNVELKDPEYMPVWGHKDQRRLGALQAMGYELLKPEHIHPNFKEVLKFSSEGMLEWEDVVCLRVHKSILFAKRKKVIELSKKQLSNTSRPPRTKSPGKYELEDELDLGGLELYNA
jgi:hypothetical protein